MSRPRAALAMDADLAQHLFAPDDRARLEQLVDLSAAEPLVDFESPRARAVLTEVEVLVTGWGCARIDAEVLARATELRAIIHAGGSVKGHLSPACWERGILVSSAAHANAKPVAEYTAAMVILSGKRAHALATEYRTRRSALDGNAEYRDVGNHGRVVGIVGASHIGRQVISLLQSFDYELLVVDPYLSDRDATELRVTRTTLDELLSAADIVTLHVPLTNETSGMLDRRRLALLRDGAVLINTARGQIVDQAALETELVSGRISAVIDTTDPWILPATSPLYTLPNVVLTPHIAGSLGNELTRLGALAVSELDAYCAGAALRHEVRFDDLAHSA